MDTPGTVGWTLTLSLAPRGTMTIVNKLILAAEDGKIDEAERKDLQEQLMGVTGEWE